MTSASMTLSDDFVRSWLRSNRTVSRFVSTSSLPPVMKPATRTRWNGETSIFGRMGVSMGISKYEGPQATAAAASRAPALTSARLLTLRVFPWARTVIDFLEEPKVLTDRGVTRLDWERFFVRLAGLVELAFAFVRDREVVMGGSVGGVDFDRPLPPVDGFAPETALRDVDAERNLLLRVAACVGECRRSRQECDGRTGCYAKGHHWMTFTIYEWACRHVRQLRPLLSRLGASHMP